MEPSCIHQSEIPGTNRLFLDYLYHFDRVSSFYGWPFSDLAALPDLARTLPYPPERRRTLVSALRKQNGDSPALAKLGENGTVAVVTGQQVGLLSGPAFTIFKALTAVKLAQYLGEQGITAVPIFWAASEDHDLAEVDHSWVFDHHGTPARISLANAVTNGGPVGRVEFNDTPLPELRRALGELPFADDVIGRLSKWYRPGATFAGAFIGFLKDLLHEFEVLFVDPLEPEIREIAAPFFRDIVPKVPDLTAALRKRNRELVAAGYHAQVVVDEDASLLFLLGGNKRTAVRWKDGRFSTKEGNFSAEQLASEANRLSPNALLRPVIQDYLLPTAAYVAGPSETAYMAQGQVLYDKLLGRMPVVFPRNSFTLLDARATKLMDKFGLRLPDLLGPREYVTSRIAGKFLPSHVTQHFDSLRSHIKTQLDEVRSELSRFDPTLEKAAEKSSAKIAYQIEKLSQKAARETLRRDQRASKDADYLINTVYPHRHLQERFYSIVPFLAKYGWDLPQRLFENIQLTCPHHMVRTI
jgi:bacillithiol biosynthesis cysteine-adding enzyme BshC